MVDDIRDRAELFEKEEPGRFKQMERSVISFESIQKSQKTVWQRFTTALNKCITDDQGLKPFDSFAHHHMLSISA